MIQVSGWTAVLVLFFVLAPLARADYDAGQRAWGAGHAAEALGLWRAAAGAGDRRAMLALGRLYAQGHGAPQDYVEAHKWFNLAASKGEAAALQARDALEEKMSPQQVAAAQERAAAWQSGAVPVMKPVEQPAMRAGPPTRAIREAQEMLVRLGYAPGAADGIWGKTSIRAYRAFLQDLGQLETDALTPQALRFMREALERRTQDAADERQESTAREISRLILETPAPAERKERPDLLHRAARLGDANGLRGALDSGSGVDERDSDGWTALMHAVNEGYPALVALLLEARADVDLRAPDGATALYMAASHARTEIVEMLLEAGADIMIRGRQGKTSVDAAKARYGDADAARQGGAPPAVLALLQGMTLEEMKRLELEREAERRRQAEEKRLAAERLRRQRKARRRDQARQREEARRPEVLRQVDAAMPMVRVEGGSFTMGCVPRRDGACRQEETPARQVQVSSFEIGKYEVTKGLWKWLMGRIPSTPDNKYCRGDSCPVFGVGWRDVQGFIRRLNAHVSQNVYRLPTEAEWEYAGRGGRRSRQFRFAGSNYREQVAWCSNLVTRVRPVGQKPPNELGLHDMSGNVSEWVQDWFGRYRSSGTASDPHGPSTGSRKVTRGGSGANYQWACRLAARVPRAYDSQSGGFRLVRVSR